jgi:hypothetical protein
MPSVPWSWKVPLRPDSFLSKGDGRLSYWRCRPTDSVVTASARFSFRPPQSADRYQQWGCSRPPSFLSRRGSSRGGSAVGVRKLMRESKMRPGGLRIQESSRASPLHVRKCQLECSGTGGFRETAAQKPAPPGAVSRSSLFVSSREKSKGPQRRRWARPDFFVSAFLNDRILAQGSTISQ